MELKILFPRLQFSRDLWTVLAIAIILLLASAGPLYISSKGIAASMRFSFMSTGLHYQYPAYFLVATGLVFILTAILSVIAVVKDSKPLFCVSMSLHLIVILLLTAAGAMSHTLRGEMLEEFEGRLRMAIRIYEVKAFNGQKDSKTLDGRFKINGENEDDWAYKRAVIEMDQVQNQYLCCGKDNFTDWVRYNPVFAAKNAGNQDASGSRNSGYLPDSCCWGKETCQRKKLTKDSKDSETDAYVFKRGCLKPLNADFQTYLANMCAWATVYLFAIIVILMGMSIIMCKNAKRSYYLPVKPSIQR